jgi:hypothetical protein
MSHIFSKDTTITLSFVDDEQDRCKVTSTAELLEAIRFFKGQNKGTSLDVHVE